MHFWETPCTSGFNATRIIRFHSLSLVVTDCQLLSLVVTFVFTRCHSLHHSLTLAVTRCISRLSFHERSHLSFNKFSTDEMTKLLLKRLVEILLCLYLKKKRTHFIMRILRIIRNYIESLETILNHIVRNYIAQVLFCNKQFSKYSTISTFPQ